MRFNITPDEMLAIIKELTFREGNKITIGYYKWVGSADIRAHLSYNYTWAQINFHFGKLIVNGMLIDRQRKGNCKVFALAFMEGYELCGDYFAPIKSPPNTMRP